METESIAGFRLSPQQEHIAAAADDAGYPVSAALFLCEGPLELMAMRDAIGAVVKRHEILRTVFRKQRGLKLPLQVIFEGEEPDIRYEDWSGLSAEERELALEFRMTEAARGRSTASESPVLSATLFRLAHEEHALLVTISSLCADVVSFLVMADELRQKLAGETSDAELIQYADVTEWQHDMLDSTEEGAEAARTFWRNQIHTPLVLPLEAATGSGAKEGVRFGIPPEDVDRLRAVAHAGGASEADLLLSAWHALLHRMTGEMRTVVLMGSAGREYDEIKNAIGLFSRSLPVAVEFDGKSSLEKVLRTATALSRQARDQQDWFAPGSAATCPAIGFDFLELRRDTEEHRITISPVAVRANEEAFKLHLFVIDASDGLSFEFEYDSARYARATMERLGASFMRLLAQAVAQPRLPFESFSLLTGDGKLALLAQGTGAAAEFPRGGIHGAISAQSMRTPDAIAVCSGTERLSYAELESRSNRLARYLQECGVVRGSLVGVCVSRSASMMVPVLAVLKAGGAYVPLSADQPKARIAQQLAGIEVLLTEGALADLLPEFAGPQVLLDGSERPWEQLSEATVEVEVTGDDLAYVIYTSGSTGTPKGVGVRHRNLMNYATHIVRELGLANEPLQYALVSTLSADLGNTVIYPALLTGGCLHVLPFDVAADPAGMSAYQREHEIDVLKIVPSHLGSLLEGGCEVLPRRYLILGGEVLKPSLVERVGELSGCEVINHYGPTETTVGSLMLRLKDYDWKGRTTVPIGRPIANTRVYVLDRNQELVPVGVTGELYIAGAGVTSGYVGQAEKTAERFVADPFHAGELMYRTGDLVRWLGDGVVEFLGRSDDQVKIRGYRVEPGEIEAVLASQPGVRQCVVVSRGRPENADDKQVVAYAVLDRQMGVTVEALKQALKERLPDYMVPSALVSLSKLPLTSNGKVDRQALPAPEERAAREYKAPATLTEELVAQIWGEVLKVDRISTDENFFDLGGHSLLATQVISRIREAFQLEIPLRTIFEQPTVSGFAERVESARLPGGSEEVPRMTRVGREGPLALSFAQQRLWILDQMEPNNSIYNIARMMRLKGNLDETALTKSLNQIIQRHETLRTWFSAEGGQPVQHIEPGLEVRITQVDLSGMPADERETKAGEIAADEGRRPFDLSVAPLLRAMLLKLDADDHVLILSMHHIVSDAWSAGVFMRELSTLYDGNVNGRPVELPELVLDYADYAAWQREWLRGEALEKELAFWRDELAGAPPLLTLPTDRERPKKQTFAGDMLRVVLPAEVYGPLKALCRSEGVTLFMALIAGYQTLLSRLAGQEKVVVGTDSANRLTLETERMIGFFINLMPLKLDLSGDPTFREVLKQVRATTLACYAHQEMPFDKNVEELRPERTLSHNPIVQVLFVMQNTPSAERKLGRVEVSGFSHPITRSKFDIALFAVERTETIDCSWVYSTELFNASTIGNMAEMYDTLLRDAVAEPESRVSALTLMSDEQKVRMNSERLERRQSSQRKLMNAGVKAIELEIGKKE